MIPAERARPKSGPRYSHAPSAAAWLVTSRSPEMLRDVTNQPERGGASRSHSERENKADRRSSSGRGAGACLSRGESGAERFRDIERALDVLEETPSFSDPLEIKPHPRSLRSCLLRPVRRFGAGGSAHVGSSTRCGCTCSNTGAGGGRSRTERSGGGPWRRPRTAPRADDGAVIWSFLAAGLFVCSRREGARNER
jgi:hypothetical protein